MKRRTSWALAAAAMAVLCCVLSFYRATDARTTPGSGLGLAIVDQIVHEHGGSVFVEETEGGGATVGFTLPEVE